MKYYAHNQQHSCDDWMRFALTPLPSLDNADHDRPGRHKIVKTILDCDQVLMELWQVHAAAGGPSLHQAGLHSQAGRPAPRHQTQEEAS